MTVVRHIPTRLGAIAVEIEERGNATPIIFLHGVYLDRRLWDYQVAALRDRTLLTVDMPLHGESAGTPEGWSLADCATMLLEILDQLQIPQVIAVGHSWGSMTILRAAVQQPQRFAAVGLCNMPLEPGNSGKIAGYMLQSLLLPLRSFYTAQAAKVLFAPASLAAHPELLAGLQTTMGKLSNRAVRQVDMAVVINPEDDGFAVARQLKVPALALRGEQDYVPDPPGIPVTIVPGGHMSPLEAPAAVSDFVQPVIELADAYSTRRAMPFALQYAHVDHWSKGAVLESLYTGSHTGRTGLAQSTSSI